jgi:hypothetical protein
MKHGWECNTTWKAIYCNKKKKKKADELAATVLYQAENDITCCAL